MNYDIFDLVSYLAEQKYGPTEYDLEDEDSLEDFVQDHYGIDIENFEMLIKDLLPLCTISQSPLTNIWYKGFGTGSIWLINKKVEE